MDYMQNWWGTLSHETQIIWEIWAWTVFLAIVVFSAPRIWRKMRLWGEKWRMHRDRQKVIDVYLSDGITDLVEELVHKNKLTKDEAKDAYRRIGRGSHLHDLLFAPSATTTKEHIRWRLGLGRLWNKVGGDKLTTTTKPTEEKKDKKSFLKIA